MCTSVSGSSLYLEYGYGIVSSSSARSVVTDVVCTGITSFVGGVGLGITSSSGSVDVLVFYYGVGVCSTSSSGSSGVS